MCGEKKDTTMASQMNRLVHLPSGSVDPSGDFKTTIDDFGDTEGLSASRCDWWMGSVDFVCSGSASVFQVASIARMASAVSRTKQYTLQAKLGEGEGDGERSID